MALRVHSRTLGADGGRWRLSFAIDGLPAGSQTVWLEGPAEVRPAHDRLDPLAGPAMLAGLMLGRDVHLAGPVSRVLVEALNTRLQDVLSLWLERERIIVSADDLVEIEPAEGGWRACTFSGGVDSMHAMLRHRGEIDAAVVVAGYDYELKYSDRFEQVLPDILAAVELFDVPALLLKTNIRDVLDPVVSWEMSFGSAMAMTAHALAGRVRSFYWPSSTSYDSPGQYGSHPLLDDYWSTPAMAIVPTGSDRRRVQKVEDVATCENHERVLGRLRVCWQPAAGGLNCGRCEKCLRTMVALASFGRLGECRFDEPLTAEKLESLKLWTTSLRFMWQQNLDNLRRLQIREDLAAAIEKTIFLGTPKPPGWAPRRTIGERMRRLVPGSIKRIARQFRSTAS